MRSKINWTKQLSSIIWYVAHALERRYRLSIYQYFYWALFLRGLLNFIIPSYKMNNVNKSRSNNINYFCFAGFVWTVPIILGMSFLFLFAYVIPPVPLLPHQPISFTAVLKCINYYILVVFGSQFTLQVTFLVAALIHIIESIIAFALSIEMGCDNTFPLWTLQTLLLGYPSLRLLLIRRKSTAQVWWSLSDYSREVLIYVDLQKLKIPALHNRIRTIELCFALLEIVVVIKVWSPNEPMYRVIWWQIRPNIALVFRRGRSLDHCHRTEVPPLGLELAVIYLTSHTFWCS